MDQAFKANKTLKKTTMDIQVEGESIMDKEPINVTMVEALPR